MTLRLNGIGKTFSGVPVLVDVTFDLKPGEVHALVGENGAGKTTLINIMTGVHHPTSGTVTLDGKSIKLDGPLDAIEKGISVVPQERNILVDLSIAENVFLNRLPRKHGFVDYEKLNDDARYWLSVVGLNLDVRNDASTLSPGQGQLLEIARAVSQKCRFLLLDEPTASIGEDEANRLFDRLQSLKESGKALLFVSHKLEEVYRLCDRVTVIRDGRVVIEGVDLSDIGRDVLVKAMVGREFVRSVFSERGALGATALELRDVNTPFGHTNVNLVISRGEIVGLYGLLGAGRTELARSIMGFDKITSGEIVIDGKLAKIKNPAEALKRYGLAYVSEDRKGEGLIMSDTVERNASMAIWDRLAGHLGLMSSRRIWPAIQVPLKQLGVKMTSATQVISDLSGGNQQKVSVAKWIAADAEILIFDEPTVGIDVAAKDEMHRALWDLAGNGKAILMISSDLREVVQLSDRVLVMVEGQLRADLANSHSYDGMSHQIVRVIVDQGKNEASRDEPTG